MIVHITSYHFLFRPASARGRSGWEGAFYFADLLSLSSKYYSSSVATRTTLLSPVRLLLSVLPLYSKYYPHSRYLPRFILLSYSTSSPSSSSTLSNLHFNPSFLSSTSKNTQSLPSLLPSLNSSTPSFSISSSYTTTTNNHPSSLPSPPSLSLSPNQ